MNRLLATAQLSRPISVSLRHQGMIECRPISQRVAGTFFSLGGSLAFYPTDVIFNIANSFS
jgi:hypothetical protein